MPILAEAQRVANMNFAAPLAIATGQKYGLPPEYILAVLAKESGWMANGLDRAPFGIKATAGRPRTNLATTEERAGVLKPERHDFETFPSWEAAFDRFGELLSTDRNYRGAWAAWQRDRNLHNLIVAVSPIYSNTTGYADSILKEFLHNRRIVSALARAGYTQLYPVSDVPPPR